MLMRHAQSNYLPHIDGLRAIAVLSVVFHHFLPDFMPGGYIGVDIFFVISGYLITGIIKKEIEENNFSFLSFYERRVRRIFPALFSVLIFSFIFSYLFLLPSDFIVTLRGLVGTLFFISNFIFWRDFQEGYFGATDEALIPLIHTWSLSVEEQFYVVFPFILFFLYKLKFKNFFIVFILMITFLISIFLSEYFIDDKPVAVFFLSPFRIWELLAGVLLAFNIIPKINNRLGNEFISLICIAMIIYPCFYYDNLTVFPGISALMPVLGTVFLIHLGKNGQTTINSILELKVFTFIGLISYSLYLWHWPILVFSKYLSYNLPILKNFYFLFLISIFISSLSYFFIEQPFRGKRGADFISRKKVFSYSFTLVVILSLSGVYSLFNNGLEKRFSTEVVNFDKARKPDLKYKFCDGITNSAEWCIVGDKDKEPETLFYGDSHLLSWAHAVDEIFKNRKESAILGVLSACPAFFDLVYSGNEFRKNNSCIKRSKQVEEYLTHNEKIKNVVIVGVWPSYFRGWNKFIVDIENVGQFKNEAGASIALSNTINKIQKLKKNVILVGPVPVYDKNVPLSHANAIIQKKKFNSTNLKSQIEFNSIFYDFVNENKKKINFIDPLKWICNLECTTLVNGKSLYYDTNHLNEMGSLYYKDYFNIDLNNLLIK